MIANNYIKSFLIQVNKFNHLQYLKRMTLEKSCEHFSRMRWLYKDDQQLFGT